MRSFIAVVVCVVGCASPASADWQYTRWGMTPAEVIAASGGLLHAGSGERLTQGEATQEVAGSYSAGNLKFDAEFYFDADGLETVGLSLGDDEQCLLLQRDLLAKYGQPVEQVGGNVPRRMWADKANGNRIILVTTGLGFCKLAYARLISSAGAGL